MVSQRLKKFLDENDVRYVTISHSLAFTAREIADSAHIPIDIMVKTVMLKMGEDLAMAVIPATAKLDRHHLEETFGTTDVDLAHETDFARAFPDCEVGAMPPFGNLYSMKVFAAEDLGRHENIAFNGGTHSEVVKMPYRDYVKLVNPQFISLPG